MRKGVILGASIVILVLLILTMIPTNASAEKLTGDFEIDINERETVKVRVEEGYDLSWEWKSDHKVDFIIYENAGLTDSGHKNLGATEGSMDLVIERSTYLYFTWTALEAKTEVDYEITHYDYVDTPCCSLILGIIGLLLVGLIIGLSVKRRIRQ